MWISISIALCCYRFSETNKIFCNGSWNGIMQRRNSWQDGVFGTNCPIPPGQNFTYNLQVKDQIGSFFYFLSLAFHKAAGGYGGIKIVIRSVIPVPFSSPTEDYTILARDWFKQNHTDLKPVLDSGHDLLFLDGVLINGRGSNGYTFNVEQAMVAFRTARMVVLTFKPLLCRQTLEGLWRSCLRTLKIRSSHGTLMVTASLLSGWTEGGGQRLAGPATIYGTQFNASQYRCIQNHGPLFICH